MNDLRITSVNIGRAESIVHGNRTITTGIRKLPVPGSVRVLDNAVDGDTICDPEHHGGPDQAVYAYGADDYTWWSEQLGRDVEPGTFGDNLTIEGLPSDMAVGDRLLIGDVVLEATSPRIPCSTLAARMQDSGFGMKFRKAERPGVYFRVLSDGSVASGDAVTWLANERPLVSILDLFRLAYDRHPDPAFLHRCLDAPIAERVRATIEHKLEAASLSA